MTRRPATRTAWLGLLAFVAYAASILAANLASTHWPAPTILALSIPAGTLFAGLTFTLRDLLHETSGPRAVFAAIAVGTALSWLLASPRIAGASVLAFAISEALDSTVYAGLRSRSRLLAVAGSNVAGLLIDTVLFVPLAFGSFAAVPGQIAGKLIATALTVAVLLAARSRRRAVPR